MPTLRQLTCTIEWADTGAPFQEYEPFYGDGTVETYIVVPDHPQRFSIHLRSRGYIAEGLAMFVYIDGEYQCNRNRMSLKPLQEGRPSNETEIDFRVRQKERSIRDGNFIGREWRFDRHMIVADPEDMDANQFDHLGKIIVLVMRCRAKEREDASGSAPPTYTDLSLVLDSIETLLPEAFPELPCQEREPEPEPRSGSEPGPGPGPESQPQSGPEPEPEPPTEAEPLPQSETVEAAAEDAEGENIMSFTGLFDGASHLDHHLGLDGEPSQGGYWTWHPAPQQGSYESGHHASLDPPTGVPYDATSRHEYPERPQASQRRVHFDDARPAGQTTWSAPSPGQYDYTQSAYDDGIHNDMHDTGPPSYRFESRHNDYPHVPPDRSRYYDAARHQDHPPGVYAGWSSYAARNPPTYTSGRRGQYGDWNRVTPPRAGPSFPAGPLPVPQSPPPPLPPPLSSHAPSYRGPGHSGWAPAPGHAVWTPQPVSEAWQAPQPRPGPGLHNNPIVIPPFHPPHPYYAHGYEFVAPQPVPNQRWTAPSETPQGSGDARGHSGELDPGKESNNPADAGGQHGTGDQDQNAWGGNDNMGNTGNDNRQTDEGLNEHENNTNSADDQFKGDVSSDNDGGGQNQAQQKGDWNGNDRNDNQNAGGWSNHNPGQQQANVGAWDPNPQSKQPAGGGWDTAQGQPPAPAANEQFINEAAGDFNPPKPVVGHDQLPSAPLHRLHGPHGLYYGMETSVEEAQIEADEEPLYDVPASIAEARSSTHQVQSGCGYLYHHKRKRPEYIDTLEEPYARFVFNYRTAGEFIEVPSYHKFVPTNGVILACCSSNCINTYLHFCATPIGANCCDMSSVDQLERELGIKIEDKPTADAAKRNLQEMSKDEVIEMLLRAQNALGGQIPSPPWKVQAETEPTRDPLIRPAKKQAPNTSFLRYSMPGARDGRNETSGAGLGISVPDAAGGAPPEAPVVNEMANQMQELALQQHGGAEYRGRHGGYDTAWVGPQAQQQAQQQLQQQTSCGDQNQNTQFGPASNWQQKGQRNSNQGGGADSGWATFGGEQPAQSNNQGGGYAW